MKFTFTLVLLGMIAGIPALFLRGAVVSALWAWFIVPLNPAIPYLHLAWSVGISICLYTVLGIYDTAEANAKTVLNALVLAYVMPISALLAGFIVRYWM